MTPADIGILIHYNSCPWEYPYINNPGESGAIDDLVEMGLLESDGDRYKMTERGFAFIEILCKTALPIQVWVDKDGNILGKESP